MSNGLANRYDKPLWHTSICAPNTTWTCILLINSQLLRLLSYWGFYFFVRIVRIELTSSAWKAVIMAIIPYSHLLFAETLRVERKPVDFQSTVQWPAYTKFPINCCDGWNWTNFVLLIRQVAKPFTHVTIYLLPLLDSNQRLHEYKSWALTNWTKWQYCGSSRSPTFTTLLHVFRFFKNPYLSPLGTSILSA